MLLSFVPAWEMETINCCAITAMIHHLQYNFWQGGNDFFYLTQFEITLQIILIPKQDFKADSDYNSRIGINQ